MKTAQLLTLRPTTGADITEDTPGCRSRFEMLLPPPFGRPHNVTRSCLSRSGGCIGKRRLGCRLKRASCHIVTDSAGWSRQRNVITGRCTRAIQLCTAWTDDACAPHEGGQSQRARMSMKKKKTSSGSSRLLRGSVVLRRHDPGERSAVQQQQQQQQQQQRQHRQQQQQRRLSGGPAQRVGRCWRLCAEQQTRSMATGSQGRRPRPRRKRRKRPLWTTEAAARAAATTTTTEDDDHRLMESRGWHRHGCSAYSARRWRRFERSQTSDEEYVTAEDEHRQRQHPRALGQNHTDETRAEKRKYRIVCELKRLRRFNATEQKEKEDEGEKEKEQKGQEQEGNKQGQEQEQRQDEEKHEDYDDDDGGDDKQQNNRHKTTPDLAPVCDLRTGRYHVFETAVMNDGGAGGDDEHSYHQRCKDSHCHDNADCDDDGGDDDDDDDDGKRGQANDRRGSGIQDRCEYACHHDQDHHHRRRRHHYHYHQQKQQHHHPNHHHHRRHHDSSGSGSMLQSSTTRSRRTAASTETRLRAPARAAAPAVQASAATLFGSDGRRMDHKAAYEQAAAAAAAAATIATMMTRHEKQSRTRNCIVAGGGCGDGDGGCGGGNKDGDHGDGGNDYGDATRDPDADLAAAAAGAAATETAGAERRCWMWSTMPMSISSRLTFRPCRADVLVLSVLLCMQTLNTTASALSSASTIEHEKHALRVEDRDQQNQRELLLPTIAQRHLLTRRQQRSFYSNEVIRLLNQRKNTSAALQYIEDAHDKWNRRQESCHRANLTPFGVKLHLNRNLAGHVNSPRYQVFERAERLAQRTADFLARLFQKSVPKHLHPKGRESREEHLSSTFAYEALTSANLLDPSDVVSGRMIVGSGIVIEDRGVNMYAYQLGRGHHLQFHANYSYDSDESVFKCRWYRELERRWSGSFSRLKHLAGIWSSPYFDCGFSDHWLITYAAPIIAATIENASHTGEVVRMGRGAGDSSVPASGRGNGGGGGGSGGSSHNNDTTGLPVEEETVRRLLGVATISINLNRLDMDQCPGDDPLFANTHLCDTANSKCEFIPDKGFRRGNYRCRCLEGFYLPSSLVNVEPVISGHSLEVEFVEKNMNITEPERTSIAQLRCLPCPPGCVTCEDEAPCFVEYNETLRGSLVIAQLACSCLVLLMMALIYRLRKNRRFASSMWILLEAILLGALLIYQAIVIRYFEPSALSCILEPWFRELGFATLYGAITLKIYRIVAEFQTRKAHRVCVRSKDLLRYLVGLVLSVALYMAAWTAMVVDLGGSSVDDILVNSTNLQGLRFLSCRPLVWDAVTECTEVLFLVLSLRLAFRLRNAHSFPEAQALTRAVAVEALFSVPLYVFKHLLADAVQPDYVFVAYFLRCHLTVTLVLMIIFLPKLCYRRAASAARSANAKGSRAAGANQSGTAVSNESGLDPAQRLHQAIVGNGELDIAEISLADMDPEEIRAELRRAYTQLEVLRNKSMRRDNPHISKRRGGRKATHRRFSLQPFHHRHKHNQQNQQHSAMTAGSTGGGTSDHHHHYHRHHGHHGHHSNHPNLPETTEVSKTPEESTASMEGTFAADGPSVTSLSAEHRGGGERSAVSQKHH